MGEMNIDNITAQMRKGILDHEKRMKALHGKKS